MPTNRNLPNRCAFAAKLTLWAAVFFALCTPVQAIDAPAVDFTDSNLPIVVIDTDSLSIVDEPKIAAWMGIIDNGPQARNHLTDAFNGYDGHIGIEIRGASSQGLPKKSYGLETRDEAGENRNVSLLGLPDENDWILYGPYIDKSLLRNVLAYWIAGQMGRYASRTAFCELVLNGQYQGVYVLMEQIKRDGDRVDIARLRPDDIAGDQVTGGYIVQIDRQEENQTGGWYSAYGFGASRLFYQFYYPRPDDIVPPQAAYLQTFFNTLEAVLAGDQFADPSTGYSRYIDVGSLVDYLLVNEIGKNVDAYRLSMFMHKNKDSDGGKLAMGPVWDFNLAFGNVNFNVHPSAQVRRPTNEGLQIYNSVVWFSSPFWFWWRRILQDEAMVDAIDRRWRQVRSELLQTHTLTGKIDEMAAYLDEAQERNFTRWPILGQYVWPNDFVGQTYADEVEFLKRWLVGRMGWMDQGLLPLIQLVPDLETDRFTAVLEANPAGAETFALGQNAPNPFNPSTLIPFVLPAAAQVELAVFNLAGQRVATLARGLQGAGQHQLYWDGRDDKGQYLSSGLYIYRLQAGEQQQVRKLLLVR